MAQESRWEIINNILEPEERKISISHDHTLQIVRNPLPINPFTLLLCLKPKKVPVRLSSGASPPMSSQVSSHVNLLHSVQVHKHSLATCSNQFHSTNAPINVKPEGGGLGQPTGIWPWCISPGWGFWPDIMHMSILKSRWEVNHLFLLILTILLCPGGGDFDNFF